MAGLGALAVPALGSAQQAAPPSSLLPIRTPKIDHLDVIVPNVESSARFYMGLFNTTLHAQPFQGGFRYFVLFGELPPIRGKWATRHRRFTRARHLHRPLLHVGLRLPARQRRDFGGARRRGGEGGAGQTGGPRRHRRHLLGSRRHRDPVPARARYAGHGGGAVGPRAVAQRSGHAARRRSRAAARRRSARRAFGSTGSCTARSRCARRAPGARGFRSATRGSGCSRPQAGQKPHIEHFGVKVAPFDAQKVTAGLQALGARVTPSPYETGVVRLTDPDGISLEVVARS